MNSVRILPSCLCATFACALLLPLTARSQDDPVAKQPETAKQNAAPADNATAPTADEIPPSLQIQILDEPKGIDPATLLPPAVAAKVTVKFERQPLRDIVKWLQQEQKINVLVDYRELAKAGVLVGEPITDHSDDQPLYLLLNRFLGDLTLDWYYEDETLHVSTAEDVQEHKTTVPYNLGDLFDNGFKSQAILKTIASTTATNSEDAVLLGDVLFVRQTFKGHLRVSALISALRKHGRRTFTLDPPQHELFRQKLTQNVSVQFDAVPLKAAIGELARQTGAEIRLDLKELSSAEISERTPVSLKMADRPLSTVLQSLLLNERLTWNLRDGVMWITTEEKASEEFLTAVFDVRDLCNSPSESIGLMRAVQTQTRGRWDDVDGEGGTMIPPKTGILVVRQDARTMNDLLKLIESYRTALRSSKPRPSTEINPKDLITKYYRLPKDIAGDIEKLLPDVIQPETWKSSARPAATGTIRAIASRSSVIGNGQQGSVISNSVLIIRQSREIHESIEKLIVKVLNGDAGDIYRSDATIQPGMGGMGGAGGGMMGGGMGGMGGGMGGSGGGGGGGFGGGFFSVPSKPIELLRDKSPQR